jgi:hypothetical protein
MNLFTAGREWTGYTTQARIQWLHLHFGITKYVGDFSFHIHFFLQN